MTTASTAVLFVHGIQGQPKQFQFLIDALPPEVQVRAPMLPGHGASAKEFHASGRKEWLAAVRRETKKLRAEGKRVIYVGHSMGCLLGLKVSKELGNPYAGMLLLCCPFYPIISGGLRNGLRFIFQKQGRESQQVRVSRAANSVPVNGLPDVLRLAHPYAELLRLIGEVRQMEPKSPAHVRFRFASADQAVKARSVPYAGKWPGADICVMADCTHNCFSEQAKRELQKDLFELLAEENA